MEEKIYIDGGKSGKPYPVKKENGKEYVVERMLGLKYFFIRDGNRAIFDNGKTTGTIVKEWYEYKIL